jgi:pyruvate-formate lyase-activating enzyme
VTEPVVSYPLREVLDSMKADIKATRDDVAELKTGSALRVAEDARTAAQRAVWATVASPVVAGVVAWLISRR